MGENNITIEQAEALAKKHLKIETLETRHSDSLDFYDIAVWNIRDLISAAFEAGKKAK